VDERTTIEVPETTAQAPMGLAVLPERHRLALSPLNRRRWLSFKANRRGYWAFWIFMVLFVLSLFAEFIANDKPFYVRFEGRSYFPVFVTYPETAFGGEFETAADYRDPYLAKLIAEKGGFMLWPPIRYSYNTHNLDLPTPAPSKPTWLLTEAECKSVVERKGLNGCSDLEYNWLGTDDQGRDVAARLIYGFRLSVVFGLVLTIISSVVGVAAGAVQGYFGGWTDLLFQRFIEIWTSIPSLYLLLIISSVLVPGFFVLLGILLLFSWVSLVGLVRAEFLRGRNFEYIQAARALGVSNRTIMFRHLLPNAMVATGLALARRDALARQGQHSGAVARHLGLPHRRDHALALDLHRRSRARRLRPAKDVRVSDGGDLPKAARGREPFRRVSAGSARDARGRSRVLRDQEGRDRRAGRRIGLG